MQASIPSATPSTMALNLFPITLSTGSYSVEDINDEIQWQLWLNYHNIMIVIDANWATRRATLTLDRGYQVDFNVANSINIVFELEQQVTPSIGPKTVLQKGEHIVNIISIKSILVNRDIIHESYVNGTQQSTIYSFFPDVDPGMKMIQIPRICCTYR